MSAPLPSALCALLCVASAAAAAPTPGELAQGEPGYQAILAGQAPIEGSASVGLTGRGRLRGGVELPPEGEHHLILEGCRERGTAWGTEELVRLIESVAAEVAQVAPGPRLAVCNLSQEGGRRITWSRSHRAGRDVDLAFFVRRVSDDVAVETPDLIRMRHDGLSLETESRWAFDFPRNWALVKALAMQDEAPVQWIFAREGLVRRLLKHARAAGEPEAVVARVSLIIKQPSDADRHDDHFHVRLYCSPDDRAAGCLDTEPRWPWFAPDPLPMAARISALALGLRDPDPDVRAKVLKRLVDLDAMDAAGALAEVAILDPRSELRGKAATALLEWNARVGGDRSPLWGWTWAMPRSHRQRAADEVVVRALEAFIRAPGGGVAKRDEAFEAAPSSLQTPGHAVAPWPIGEGRPRTARHLHRAYALLTALATPRAVDFLKRALGSQRLVGDPAKHDEGVPEARLAARAAGQVMELALVPALLRGLSHVDAKVRIRVDTALRRITNHTQRGARWGRSVAAERLARQAEWWRDWWQEHATMARDELVQRGFRRRGQRFVELEDEENIPKLVKLTLRDDELGYNADRLLVRITGKHTPRAWPPNKKHARWLELTR